MGKFLFFLLKERAAVHPQKVKELSILKKKRQSLSQGIF